MATDKQIAANRLNAKKSTGPRTAEGKAKSSRNGVRHGLLAKSVVLQSESQERFEALLAQFVGEYYPEGPTQTALVQIMTAAHWRMLRIWNMEVAGVDYEFNKQTDPSASADYAGMQTPTRAHFAFRNLTDGSRSLDVMNRYEARLDRQFAHAFERLCRLKQLSQTPEGAFFAQVNPIHPVCGLLEIPQPEASK